MKVYKVKVNGKVYEVELESVTEQAGSVQAPKAEAKVPEAALASAPAAQASGEGTPLKAPMQGTIIAVNVNVGDSVKKGQVVAILEAMKLENEIVAHVDGVIKQVLVTKGQTVNSQDVLVVIG